MYIYRLLIKNTRILIKATYKKNCIYMYIYTVYNNTDKHNELDLIEYFFSLTCFFPSFIWIEKKEHVCIISSNN